MALITCWKLKNFKNLKKNINHFFKSSMLSKVKFNDLETQKIQEIKKKFNNFLKSWMVSKVKCNDLDAISR